ncbi:hypothetical protein RN51_03502 [Microbacterium oxydans]|uniref:Uncharacterized protein n=1 Tax=Microbacterium oxydans TaxID=82380 RepID=A0A0F0KCM0_9MICO|nr:hypothetical protein RN51_03502 [Microbacterium oxydans]
MVLLDGVLEGPRSGPGIRTLTNKTATDLPDEALWRPLRNKLFAQCQRDGARTGAAPYASR